MPNEYSLFEQGHFMSTLLLLYGEHYPLPEAVTTPTRRKAINLLDRLIAMEKKRPGQYSLAMETRLGLSSVKLEGK